MTDEKDAKRKRLDQTKRMLAVASELLDVERAVYALPCRDDAIKNVLQAKLFEAAKSLIALVNEMTDEVRATMPEDKH